MSNTARKARKRAGIPFSIRRRRIARILAEFGASAQHMQRAFAEFARAAQMTVPAVQRLAAAMRDFGERGTSS